MRRLESAAAVLAYVATLSSWAPGAAADPASDKARADELFKAGRALAKDAKWSAACPKFEESQRLDPAPGTLLNLGVCHARTGKNALAYAELAESLSIAQKAKRADRETIAHDELTYLEPKIARLTVKAPADPNVTVSLDGRSIAPMALDVAQVVDPGTHALRAVAPGKKGWESSIALVAGDRRTVEVPALEKADDAIAATTAAPPTPSATPTPAATALTPSTTITSPRDATPTARDEHSGRRTAAFVAGGLGVAALGAGAYFALHASSLQHDADDLGAQGNASDAASKADSARSAVTLARVGLGLGVLGVGVGTYLLVTSRSDEAPAASASASVRVAPVVGIGFAGVAVGGGW